MDKTDNKEIKTFVNKLKKELNSEKIILFGSRVDDSGWKRSDYDFIVVSSKFKGMHWLDRISRVVRLWDAPSQVDILTYTPEEFEHKKEHSSVVRSAMKNCKILAG